MGRGWKTGEGGALEIEWCASDILPGDPLWQTDDEDEDLEFMNLCDNVQEDASNGDLLLVWSGNGC